MESKVFNSQDRLIENCCLLFQSVAAMGVRTQWQMYQQQKLKKIVSTNIIIFLINPTYSLLPQFYLLMPLIILRIKEKLERRCFAFIYLFSVRYSCRSFQTILQGILSSICWIVLVARIINFLLCLGYFYILHFSASLLFKCSIKFIVELYLLD